MQLRQKLVFPFLALAGLALLAGLWAGLLRLGWMIPGNRTPLPVEHGALMVSGFLGTLIALERVVAIRRTWMYLGPALTGLGWILALLVSKTSIGIFMITLGSLVFVAILGVMIRRETRIFTIVMGIGALCWLIGNLFWLSGKPVYQIVLWWMAFLVLTISGERLELSRVLRPASQQHLLFGAAVAVFLVGVALSIWLRDPGTRLAGAGMLLVAAWLIRFDLARRNLRHPAALTRFIAYALFIGYLWLAASGLIAIVLGAQTGGGFYDALLHAVFIGFVISMIFGHAPIIVPAVTGMMVVYSRIFPACLVFLHGSLLLRIAGDLLGSPVARRWGGLLNEVAILVFLGAMALTIRRARRKRS